MIKSIKDALPLLTLVTLYLFTSYGLLLDSPFVLFIIPMWFLNTVFLMKIVKIEIPLLYYSFTLGLIIYMFISKLYINNVSRTIVDIEYVKFDTYKYTTNGNIYVNYKDPKTLKTLYAHTLKFDPIYMKLNNCEPILLRTTYEYWTDCEEVKETVKCYKDISID